jgi:Zn-dependent peptidase ImmA (M78 family)/transcriptional regulator with XRE-family HTH domain
MIGTRVKLARELCGITQSELAESIGTTQSAVASIESGLYRPSAAYLKSIALKTGFNPTFFDRGELAELPFGSLLYRVQASVKPPSKTSAHAHAQVAFELALFMSSKLKQIPVNIPTLTDDPPDVCAAVTRSVLRLAPHTPVRDLIPTLEKNGVLVLSLPLEIRGFDAFSAWAGRDPTRPVIALLRAKTAYRERFTSAEELAHLVMHSPLKTSVKQADVDARAFAQEFLLPAEAMRIEMQPPITLSSLSALKPRWGASIAFLVKRAESLSLITRNQSRYLFQQLRANWGVSEPGDQQLRPERPRLMKKMTEMLYGSPINFGRLAKDSGVPQRILRGLLGEEANSPTARRILEFRKST